MRGVLLGVAAGIAALSVPASAHGPAKASFVRSSPDAFPQFARAPDVRIHRGADWGRDQRGGGDFRRDRDRREGNGQGDVFFGYRDYQGDTLWRSGGFNDWWHDRPDRAFPRWVGTNQNCERMWWSGSGWRC